MKTEILDDARSNPSHNPTGARKRGTHEINTHEKTDDSIIQRVCRFDQAVTVMFSCSLEKLPSIPHLMTAAMTHFRKIRHLRANCPDHHQDTKVCHDLSVFVV